MDDVEALLGACRSLGSRRDWVTWGGGNASVKTPSRDFRGRMVQALFIKGSGLDLKGLRRVDMACLDLSALRELQGRPSLDDQSMLSYLASSRLSEGPRSSIETLLHAFIPEKFVLHTHADATAALVDNPQGKAHVQRCWKGRVPLLPYQRPGFALSVAAGRAYQKDLPGLMLDKHGLVTWGGSATEALSRMRRLIAQAARYLKGAGPQAPSRTPKSGPNVSLPALRGALSGQEAQILCLDESREARAFSLRADAAKLCAQGPATPDHLLWTKPRALYVRDPRRIGAAVQGYRRWYGAYFKKHAASGMLAFDSAPRIVVIRGWGVVSSGRDPQEAGRAAEVFRHSMGVRCAAARLGAYRSISTRQIFEFEYWPLETYKLGLAPAAGGELRGRVAVVTGAARGIGKACALRLAEEGACVALLDRDRKGLRALASQMGERALGVPCDVTQEAQVRGAFQKVVRRWGGMDLLVNNAGLARCAPVETAPLSDWEASFAVNATGQFLCAREAARIFMAQGMGGAMVFVSSKNVLAPGKDFSAYSASKAAQTQLAKVLALELAKDQVRINCVLPDGVFEDSRLWDGIRESRARAHGIRPEALEDFYTQRNLLQKKVRPRDVAEAVLFLASQRSSRTTGALLSVDGGVQAAFAR